MVRIVPKARMEFIPAQRVDVSRYAYGTPYIPDFAEFWQRVQDKTIVPHQVEIQPGPAGGKICWLECPYCYGGSAHDTGERLSRDRAISILKQMATGGVRKVIFAGYATDPLHSPEIEDLVAVAGDYNLIVGFNTKALQISPRLVDLLVSPGIAPQSYMSVSVDAGSNWTYNAVHAVPGGRGRLYDRVRDNVTRLAQRRAGRGFEIAATYLVSRLNADEGELRRFVTDFRRVGCDVLRFSFPQLPRGKAVGELPTVPNAEECQVYAERLRALVVELDTPACRVLFADPDSEHNFFQKARTTPCVARFVFPAVGFDGWLYHCSQSAAPNFRAMALGNLAERDFWDCFYDYDVSNLQQYFDGCTAAMAAADCRCDRKEHLVNGSVVQSGVFGHG